MEMPRTKGPEAHSPDEAVREREGKKTRKEMRNELLFYFHPDIDGLIHEAEELALRNQAVRQVIEVYKEAEATGNDKKLRELYDNHVLGGEQREATQTAERKHDLLQEARDLQARLSAYLMGTDEEFEEMTAKFDAFWDDLDEEWQRLLGMVREIHNSLCRLREVLDSVALGDQWKETERQAAAKRLWEELGTGLGAAIKKMEEEKIDPAAITQSLLQFHQQVAAHVQALLRPVAEETTEAKKEAKEDVATDRGQEEYDADDDLEDETVASTAPRLTPIALAATEEEDAPVPIAPIVLLAVAGAMLEMAEDGTMVVHTKDQSHIHHLEVMTHKKFLDGYVDGRDDEGYRFRVTSQVLPWCAAPEEEFFALNHHHQDIFPHAFRRLKRPGTDEYFPEAVFLDDTGAALKAYLDDNWRGYLQSAEYQAYLAEYEPDQSRVLTV